MNVLIVYLVMVVFKVILGAFSFREKCAPCMKQGVACMLRAKYRLGIYIGRWYRRN